MPVQPSTVLSILALAVARPVATELVFEPEEGTALARTFVFDTTAALDELAVEVDGEDLSAMLGEFSFEVEGVQTYQARDEFVSVEDGRVVELHRTYEKLAGESETMVDAAMASETTDSTVSSELEGETVVFTWDPDAEEYDKASGDGSDVDEDLLQGLSMSMDLSGFLPDEPVEEGDSWEIGVMNLAALYMPGGNLGLLPDEMPDVEGFDMDAMTEMMSKYQTWAMDQLEDWVDGSATATFSGVQEVDGVRVAVIDIEMDMAFEADFTDVMEEILSEVLSQMDIPMDIDVTISSVVFDLDTEGEGKLMWSIEGKHGHSLDLAVDYDFDMSFEMSFDAAGESHDIAADIAGSGTYEADVDVE